MIVEINGHHVDLEHVRLISKLEEDTIVGNRQMSFTVFITDLEPIKVKRHVGASEESADEFRGIYFKLVNDWKTYAAQRSVQP